MWFMREPAFEHLPHEWDWGQAVLAREGGANSKKELQSHTQLTNRSFSFSPSSLLLEPDMSSAGPY